MITHREFVNAVARRAELDDSDTARSVIEETLRTLAHTLPERERDILRERLPSQLSSFAAVPGQTEERDDAALVLELGQRLGTTPERARYLLEAVVREMVEADTELVARLRAHARSDVFDDALGRPEAPSEPVTGQPGAPAPLTEADLARELKSLPEWNHDGNGLHRTVVLPGDRHRPLLERVRAAARSGNQHVGIDEGDDAVTFTVGTGEDTVTENDVRLAHQIEDAVTETGSGGRPGTEG